MSEREYRWSETGLASAERNGVSTDEVRDALHAPAGMRWENEVGDALLIVTGMAGTGRVIAVFCDRADRFLALFWITNVRALRGEALDEWRRRVL